MSFEDTIAQECDHDGHLFSIDSYVIDLRGSNSAYNYSSESNCKSFEVLLDNQSTCDVIVNNLFLRNIRNSNWTLVLQTLSGV